MKATTTTHTESHSCDHRHKQTGKGWLTEPSGVTLPHAPHHYTNRAPTTPTPTPTNHAPTIPHSDPIAPLFHAANRLEQHLSTDDRHRNNNSTTTTSSSSRGSHSLAIQVRLRGLGDRPHSGHPSVVHQHIQGGGGDGGPNVRKHRLYLSPHAHVALVGEGGDTTQLCVHLFKARDKVWCRDKMGRVTQQRGLRRHANVCITNTSRRCARPIHVPASFLSEIATKVRATPTPTPTPTHPHPSMSLPLLHHNRSRSPWSAAQQGTLRGKHNPTPTTTAVQGRTQPWRCTRSEPCEGRKPFPEQCTHRVCNGGGVDQGKVKDVHCGPLARKLLHDGLADARPATRHHWGAPRAHPQAQNETKRTYGHRAGSEEKGGLRTGSYSQRVVGAVEREIVLQS